MLSFPGPASNSSPIIGRSVVCQSFNLSFSSWNCASLFGAPMSATFLFERQRKKRARVRRILSNCDFFFLQEVHGSATDVVELTATSPTHFFGHSNEGATGGVIICVRKSWVLSPITWLIVEPLFCMCARFQSCLGTMVLVNIHLHPKWEVDKCTRVYADLARFFPAVEPCTIFLGATLTRQCTAKVGFCYSPGRILMRGGRRRTIFFTPRFPS